MYRKKNDRRDMYFSTFHLSLIHRLNGFFSGRFGPFFVWQSYEAFSGKVGTSFQKHA